MIARLRPAVGDGLELKLAAELGDVFRAGEERRDVDLAEPFVRVREDREADDHVGRRELERIRQ